MPNEYTNADSVLPYLSGASTDGGAQADPDAALGNNRSSTLVDFRGHTITTALTGGDITVDYISPTNATGSAQIRAVSTNTIAFTPAGGTEGTAVAIANGETKILEGGGGALEQYVKVSRTSTTNMTGTMALTISSLFNNVLGFDNVSDSEASAGDTEYRAFFFKNHNAASITNLKVWIKTLGTQRVSDTTQLGATGTGKLAISSGNFNDWPTTGYVHIRDSGGTTREIVYYDGKDSSTQLNIPAAGRGLLGTTAAAGAATDTIDAVPGIRIAPEAPASQPSGAIQTIANESTAPTGRTWNTGLTAATGVSIGTVATGNKEGLWIEREIPASAVAEASVENALNWSYDAA